MELLDPSRKTQCIVCGSERIAMHHDQGYRFVVRCVDCSLVFVDPIPSAAEKVDTERQAYEGRALPETAEFFENCSRDFVDDPVIESFRGGLDWIGEHTASGKMLDIGPGTGIFLHLAREKGWDPYGIDLCDLSAEKAREEFDLSIDVGEFESFCYEPGSFDAITMLDVLEHARDPIAFLRRAHELLRPGGMLYIAVPNQQCLLPFILDRYVQLGGPAGRWIVDRLYVSPHLYYFNPDVLTRALEQTGYSVVGVRGGNVYLGRYRISWLMKLPLELVLRAGSLVNRSAKVLALARKPEVLQG